MNRRRLAQIAFKQLDKTMSCIGHTKNGEIKWLTKPGGDREMAHIHALVSHHDEQTVLTAVVL